MSDNFYFINHTRKEFCCFDKKNPVFQELTYTLKWNRGWTMEDNICVDSEYLMTDKGYKNLDSDSE